MVASVTPRGRRMQALPIAFGSLVALWLGYRFYSRYLSERLFQLSDVEDVPSRQFADGVDYVPAKRSTLWGHHFSSIAGAAPILGPAIAIVWGWAPALLWIVLGVIFMGARLDFGALVLSIRHEGKASVGWPRSILSRVHAFPHHYLLLDLDGGCGLCLRNRQFIRSFRPAFSL